MCPQTALLALLLATFSAPQASPLQSSFWDYFSQLTQEKDSAEPAQQPKHGQEAAKNLKGSSFQDGTGSMGSALQKLASRNSGFQPWFYQDANGLRQLIQGEIESLRLKLSPYTDEVGHQGVGENLETLRLCLGLLTDKLMGQVSLQAREMQQRFGLSLLLSTTARLLPENAEETQTFAAHYAEKIAFHTDQVKEIFHPYMDRLVAEIQHSMEELHKKVAPSSQATATPEQVSRSIQEFSDRLTQSARELQLKIHRSLEHLKGQLLLRLHPSSTLAERRHRSHPQDVPLQQQAADCHLCLEDLAQEVQQRAEEFRRDAALQIGNFTRTMDREVEEMKLKLLGPLPSYLEEFQENAAIMPLADVHLRLDSLWTAIAQSLDSPPGQQQQQQQQQQHILKGGVHETRQ